MAFLFYSHYDFIVEWLPDGENDDSQEIDDCPTRTVAD